MDSRLGNDGEIMRVDTRSSSLSSLDQAVAGAAAGAGDGFLISEIFCAVPSSQFGFLETTYVR